MTQSMLMTSTLLIRGLELSVYLGWPEDERQAPQTVYLDIEIGFKDAPKACLTDNLDDTFCYAILINHLKETISTKKFRLIEYLGHEIHQFIQSQLSTFSRVTVRITKHPEIPGLTGGVCFSYGDGQ